MKILNILTIAAISATAFTSCKKDDNTDNNTSNPNATAFKVRMTDAPGNFSALNTQITSVDAMIDGEWVTLNSTSQTMNVLSLTNGTEQVVANDNTAETGHYTKLRFNFGTNNTISMMENSTNNQYNLAFASGTNSTVIVDIDQQVNNGDSKSVLIDFNVANSISSALGTWYMNPSMSWIEDEATGVRGQITGASRAMVKFTSQSGQQYMSWINSEGRFLVRGMQSGTYSLVVMGMATGQNSEDEVEASNIIVTEGSITNMGSLSFE